MSSSSASFLKKISNALSFILKNPSVLFPLPLIVLGAFAPLGAIIGLVYSINSFSFVWFLLFFIAIFVFLIMKSIFTSFLYQKAQPRFDKSHSASLERAMMATFPNAFTEFMAFLIILVISLVLISIGNLIASALSDIIFSRLAIAVSLILFIALKFFMPSIWSRTQVHHEVGLYALENALSDISKNWKNYIEVGILFSILCGIFLAIFIFIFPSSQIALLLCIIIHLILYALYTSVFATN